MLYLAYGYCFFFVGWTWYDWHELRCEGYPRWYLGIEFASKLLLIAGMLLFFLPAETGKTLQAFWSTAVFPIIGLETMLCVYAIRHDEEDFDYTEAVNRRIQQCAAVLTAFIIGPAGYMGFRFAYPEVPQSALVTLIVSAVVGFGLAFCWPRLGSCFKSISERKLVRWLESNKRFGRRPDEIELMDNSVQQWPGLEERTRCQLFCVRYGQDWYVGLTGPTTYCLDASVGKDAPVSEIYEQYKKWFADYASRVLLREAAKGFPDEFRDLVDEALAKNNDENA